MGNNLDNIIELKAFDYVFSRLYSIDALYAENINDTINDTVKETHSVLTYIFQ